MVCPEMGGDPKKQVHKGSHGGPPPPLVVGRVKGANREGCTGGGNMWIGNYDVGRGDDLDG